eukprot:542059-Amphidinium_carterae.1
MSGVSLATQQQEPRGRHIRKGNPKQSQETEDANKTALKATEICVLTLHDHEDGSWVTSSCVT